MSASETARPDHPIPRLREALSRVPTPVTVITTEDGDGPHGTTVSAFCSLSADPPLVMVALDRGSNLLRKIRFTSRFGINVLGVGQDEVARRCADKDAGKFDHVQWEMEDGAPRIGDVASWFLCDTEALLPGGDHEIVVGRVIGCEVSERHPLVYHRRIFTMPYHRAST